MQLAKGSTSYWLYSHDCGSTTTAIGDLQTTACSKFPCWLPLCQGCNRVHASGVDAYMASGVDRAMASHSLCSCPTINAALLRHALCLCLQLVPQLALTAGGEHIGQLTQLYSAACLRSSGQAAAQGVGSSTRNTNLYAGLRHAMRLLNTCMTCIH